MLTLTIDNREIEVTAGTKVIEAAEQVGIIIPRFCYHPALGAVGACRVCAVAFKDGPIKGVQMSCMVNAQDGMVVSTIDAEAVDFRRHVIEWLMLNHPHDCPVCDEGGHCLLQDLTIAGGHGMRRYKGLKRTHQDQYLGPLIQHEMNRCIQCYRCARYYQEYTGAKDLGVMGIGSRVYFGRSQPGTLDSPFSGNLIDICPTGVYTDKPSRFIGRRWDFQRSPSVCLHCSLGCNIVASARYRSAVRHEARPNPDVNGYFICDRGRYGYAYNNTKDRPRRALVKGDRRVLPDAVAMAATGLADIIKNHGPQCVAAVGSVRSSLETLVRLDDLCHGNGWRGPFIVHENRKALNLKAATASLTAETAVSLGALSVAENVVAFGVDPVNEAPMLALSLRQAQRLGGHITVLDPRAIEMPLTFDHLPVKPSEMGGAIRHLIQTACGGEDRPNIGGPDLSGPIETLAADLCQCRRVVVICGTDITTSQEIGYSAELVYVLRKAGIEAKLFYALEGPNAFGAGLLTQDNLGVESVLEKIEEGEVKALVVVENDVWRSCPDRHRLAAALDQLDMFIVLDYLSSPLVEKADIFLPTQTLYEAGGHWINQEGRVQSAAPVMMGGVSIAETGKGDHPPRIFEHILPEDSSKSAADLLSALMDGTGLENVDASDRVPSRAGSPLGAFQDGKRIALSRREGSPAHASGKEGSDQAAEFPKEITVLLVEWTFGTEGLSQNIDLAQLTPEPVATVHPMTADQLDLVPGGRITIATAVGELSLLWQGDKRMARNMIVVPRHYLLEWQALGATRLELNATQIRGEK
jgi:NADH-quinone oxidoreductase subunit G